MILVFIGQSFCSFSLQCNTVRVYRPQGLKKPAPARVVWLNTGHLILTALKQAGSPKAFANGLLKGIATLFSSPE